MSKLPNYDLPTKTIRASTPTWEQLRMEIVALRVNGMVEVIDLMTAFIKHPTNSEAFRSFARDAQRRAV